MNEHVVKGAPPRKYENPPTEKPRQNKGRFLLLIALLSIAVVTGIFWATAARTRDSRISGDGARSKQDGAAGQVQVQPSSPSPATTNPGYSTVTLPVGNLAEVDEPTLPKELELQVGKLPWEEKIESVLQQPSATDAEKAKLLFSLLHKLPAEATERAATEAIRLVTNADYNAVALPIIKDPRTTGDIDAILFADLMDRPETIHLPALLAIASAQDHPFAEPARQNLEYALGHDYKEDWSAWTAGIDEHLKKSGEQPTQ